MKRFTIIVGAILGGLLTAIMLINRRSVRDSHAEVTNSSALENPAQLPAREVSHALAKQIAPAPIMPGSAQDMADPERFDFSPWMRDAVDHADRQKKALTAYQHFLADARLSDTQKKVFDQIIEDTRRMAIKQADKQYKDPNQDPDYQRKRYSDDDVSQAGYERVKQTLTPEQYRAFVHDIGADFLYMVFALEGVPH